MQEEHNSMTTIEKNSLWQSYQLQHDPFSNRSPASYYPIAEWEQHLDLLHHLLHFSNVLLTVFGNKGAGKTTFLQQLLQQIDEDLLCVHSLCAKPSFSLDDLASIFRDQFGAQTATGNTTFEILESQLEELQHFQQLSVLIIDDAHLLSDQILRTLLELIGQQSENQMRMHVILFALPSVKERLAALCKKNGLTDLIYDIALEPLTGQQTRQYLEHRFRDAGLVGPFPLKDSEVNRIWKMSGGNPYQIHVSALQTMSSKTEPQKATAATDVPQARPSVTRTDDPRKEATARPVKTWKLTKQQGVSLGIALLLLTALLAVSYLQKKLQSTAAPTPVTATAPPTATNNKTEDTPVGTTPASATATTATKTKPAHITRNIIVLPSTAVSTPSTNQSLNQPSLIFVKHEDTTQNSSIPPIGLDPTPTSTTTAKATENMQTTTPPSEEQASNSKNNPGNRATDQSKKTVEKSTSAASTATTNANTTSKATTQPTAKKGKNAEEKPTTKEMTTAKPQATADKSKYNEDERFLLRQSPNRYTLQLIASVDRNLLLKESRVILNKKKYPYYLFRYGPQWHVLTYGIYDSFDEAKAAIASIPKSLRSQIKPWPRELSLIQGEIQQSR